MPYSAYQAPFPQWGKLGFAWESRGDAGHTVSGTEGTVMGWLLLSSVIDVTLKACSPQGNGEFNPKTLERQSQRFGFSYLVLNYSKF